MVLELIRLVLSMVNLEKSSSTCRIELRTHMEACQILQYSIQLHETSAASSLACYKYDGSIIHGLLVVCNL